jgi:hypothetical protein
LGCHRPRVPDRVVFERLVHVLVFGCAYHGIADEGCSVTTLRDQRHQWIEIGAMDALREIVLEAYDRLVALETADVALNGRITKAPCGGQKPGRNPIDRGKRGIKRSTAADANVVPLGTVAPANRYDSPLLPETLDTVAETCGGLPEGTNVHLVSADDSKATRERLKERGLLAEISKKCKLVPFWSPLCGWWRRRILGKRS